MKKILLSVFVSGLLIFGGCQPKKTTTTPPATVYDNSFTINGGVFKNTVVNFKNIQSAAGAYSTSGHNTSVIINGNSGDSLGMNLSIVFEGQKTGSYSLGTSSDYIVFTTYPINNPGQTSDFSSNAGGLIKITEYGAIGSKIAGTFSGEFNSIGTNYVVTNGTFRVTRTADTQ